MKTNWTIVLGLLALAGTLQAQEGPVTAQAGGQVALADRGHHVVIRREMGKWWQNPDVVSKLGLSDSQISQLNQVFYNHKMKLIDYGADMEKQDLKLQSMLDADQPDEGQVNSQVDQVLAARGRLEREFTTMNLDLRKQLSVEQWRQLKTIRGAEGGPGDHFFMYFKQKGIGPGGPGVPMMPDGTPLPPPPPGLD